MSIISLAARFVLLVRDIVLPLVRGPAGPVCTAAGWSPAPCRTHAGKSHRVPSGWAGLCDAPEEKKTILITENPCLCHGTNQLYTGDLRSSAAGDQTPNSPIEEKIHSHHIVHLTWLHSHCTWHCVAHRGLFLPVGARGLCVAQWTLWSECNLSPT